MRIDVSLLSSCWSERSPIKLGKDLGKLDVKACARLLSRARPDPSSLTLAQDDKRAFRFVTLGILLLALLPTLSHGQSLNIASKKFTESVLLGEIATQLLQAEGIETAHQSELGGTAILWNGLLEGELDIYPDYSGTLMREVLADQDVSTLEELDAVLGQFGVKMTAPIGFNNTYAIGMTGPRAQELGIEKISDLVQYPDLSGGFSNEFMDREDGWPGLSRAYNLPQTQVRGLDHDLAYRALESGDIDMMDLYSTDAEIEYYGLKVLEDDRQFFVEYLAVYLYRADLEERNPEAVRLLESLSGSLDESLITSLNARVKLDKRPDAEVAASFLNEHIFEAEVVQVAQETMWSRLWTYTLEHLWLVCISLSLAILVSIPLGILAAGHEQLGQLILGIVGVIYTHSISGTVGIHDSVAGYRRSAGDGSSLSIQPPPYRAQYACRVERYPQTASGIRAQPLDYRRSIRCGASSCPSPRDPSWPA